MTVASECDENRRLLRMLRDAREHYERLKHDSAVAFEELREAEMVREQLRAKQQEHIATCPVCRPVM
jgi:hypothetical protein